MNDDPRQLLENAIAIVRMAVDTLERDSAAWDKHHADLLSQLRTATEFLQRLQAKL